MLLSAVCGAGVLALFFMVVARAAQVGKRGTRRKTAVRKKWKPKREAPIGLRLLLPDAALLVLRQENGSLRTAAPPRLQRCRMVIVPLASERREKIPPLFFARAVGLTARETEILSLLVRGRTLPYIANELFVTTGTVKTHVRHIY